LHSFRAGFATRLHESTRDLALVARALGHRDLRTTLRYVNIEPSTLRRAIDAMLG
jgi:site-specific recombinase XerD